MNSEQSLIDKLCDNGNLDALLESYIQRCNACDSGADTFCDDGSRNGNLSKKARRDKESEKASFPNLAGFCRYLGIGTGEMEKLASEHPLQYGKILAVLEDEALNSGLSATVITAYLKKRLGYDGPAIKSEASPLQIKFEHDIFEDGE